MTQIIYGSELSAELKENMRSKVESWVSTGMRTPCLAVILVGDNPASESYVRGKEKACAAVGMIPWMVFSFSCHYQKALMKIEQLRVLILERMWMDYIR